MPDTKQDLKDTKKSDREIIKEKQTESAVFWQSLSQLSFTIAMVLVISFVPGTYLFMQNNTSQDLQIFPQEIQQENTSDEMTSCLQSNGQWVEFNNSCADLCSVYKNPQNVVCQQTEKWDNCNCGENKCWDGKVCIANPVFDDVSNLKILK